MHSSDERTFQVASAALRLASGLPPPSPFGAVAASPFGPPPPPAAGDGLPGGADVYMADAHADAPAITPPTARGQVGGCTTPLSGVSFFRNHDGHRARAGGRLHSHTV